MARTTRLDYDALDRLLIQQLDVISRRQALAVGVSDNALRHRLRPGGPWRGLLPGVYMAATGAPTTLQQEMAALLYAGSGSVITGPAALRSHHIRTELTEFVDVLVPSTRQRRDTQFVRLHRTTRMPGRIWEAGPVQYVMPARAVADTVRTLTSLRESNEVMLRIPNLPAYWLYEGNFEQIKSQSVKIISSAANSTARVSSASEKRSSNAPKDNSPDPDE